MNKLARNYLIITGLAACAGSVLHIAILFGGLDWYAFFGAIIRQLTGARKLPARAISTSAVRAC